jgi:tryptophan 2,3-dioxygenase
MENHDPRLSGLSLKVEQKYRAADHGRREWKLRKWFGLVVRFLGFRTGTGGTYGKQTQQAAKRDNTGEET